MSRNLVLLALAFLVLPRGTAAGQEGGLIQWEKDLATGLAKAKATGLALMICVNARSVEGEEEELAAKGLREVVYRDPRVVAKSREFVCVLITLTSATNDYTELSNLGIGGKIVSPQHIFVNPAGDTVLLRKEYWSHGKGDKAVEKLLEMMDLAAKKASGVPEGAGDAGDVPAEGEARAAWIAGQIAQLTVGEAERDRALGALIKADRDGDCTGALIALLPKQKKDVKLLWCLIQALGRDGLTAAAAPLAEFLGHQDPSLRGCAAVSLEYIGSPDRKIVAALVKAAGREEDEGIANHVYRALGRCGVKDAQVRALLLKMAASGKSEFATYGPCIGLAYFEGDEKAARGVEKILALIGVPGSKRGGGQNTVKRGLVSWTLAAIGDKQSGKFVREELIAKLENMKAFWVEGMRNFWDAVAKKCEGDEEAMAGIEAGVKIFVGVAKQFGLDRYGAETRNLMDDSRTGRDNSTFTPKGDNLLGGAGD